ncbi:hypothetical protein A2985_02405 [Candidatus Woesebacteria bacterium RIFCSPLOWO2_01_FULL_43_11]|uniref:Uncharacterized protein n=1 Tax=Candidatus Woesebacteria bacterium RBG_16_42_24 TaxID=1802485 RepID=A0A1F7XKB2_9BACT|nr:MAG: hypothetical protein A2V97_02310 [Candidatus Woesebacteria bacterium RBG_16_42_24]OGM67085.1 MAG: hypothetical protein A2985_02405 [Candidatus Woesebacteria bacterium RIFCSPLOWO2_01_FULL_43_11]
MIYLKTYLRFVLVWLVNYAVLSLANSYFPNFYELGNVNLTTTAATFLSSFLLTLAGRLAKTALTKWGVKADGRAKRFVLFWIVNSAAIWLIARFASLTGFGIAAYYYALSLAFAATLAQWLTRQVYKKAKLL